MIASTSMQAGPIQLGVMIASPSMQAGPIQLGVMIASLHQHAGQACSLKGMLSGISKLVRNNYFSQLCLPLPRTNLSQALLFNVTRYLRHAF